MRMIISIELM